MTAGRSLEEPSDPLLGTAYRTRSFLGRGAMGIVLDAEHVALGAEVVVKLLHVDLVQRPDFIDRMRIEAQAMSRLRSPHLTRCTDLSTTPDGRPFLVLERLHGRTLADEMAARGAFPVAEAIDIARQTLAGLAVVHRAGIVHRDIKPSNLFLAESEDGRLVKILDFGIAKVVAQGGDGKAPRPLSFPTAEGTAVGSPRCLSPEQAKGLAVDARTDLYAVGVLLYTLLTGKGPFHEVRGVVAVMQAHVLIVPEPPSRHAPQSIPPALDALIMKALEKRPEDRFAGAEEMSAALARFQIGTTSAAMPLAVRPFPVDVLVDDAAPTVVRPVARAGLPYRFDTQVVPPPSAAMVVDGPPWTSPVAVPVPASSAHGGNARVYLRALEALPCVALGILLLAVVTAVTARMWGFL